MLPIFFVHTNRSEKNITTDTLLFTFHETLEGNVWAKRGETSLVRIIV